MYRVEYYDAKGRLFCYITARNLKEAEKRFEMTPAGCKAAILRKEYPHESYV